MTATAYKASLHKLIDEINDEAILGEAYISLQEVLHPEAFEVQSAEAFEEEINQRLELSRQGNTLSHEDMGNWINGLVKP